MAFISIPSGYEMKYCMWENRTKCYKDIVLGIGDSFKELDKLFPTDKYPNRIFGTMFIKKSNKNEKA